MRAQRSEESRSTKCERIGRRGSAGEAAQDCAHGEAYNPFAG